MVDCGCISFSFYHFLRITEVEWRHVHRFDRIIARVTAAAPPPSHFFPRRHVVRPGNYVRLCVICQDLSRVFVRGPARWKSASLLLLVLILRCRSLWALRFLWRWKRFTALWDVMSRDLIERCQRLGGRHCVHSQGVTILPQDCHSRQRQTACECNIKTLRYAYRSRK